MTNICYDWVFHIKGSAKVHGKRYCNMHNYCIEYWTILNLRTFFRVDWRAKSITVKILIFLKSDRLTGNRQLIIRENVEEYDVRRIRVIHNTVSVLLLSCIRNDRESQTLHINSRNITKRDISVDAFGSLVMEWSGQDWIDRLERKQNIRIKWLILVTLSKSK